MPVTFHPSPQNLTSVTPYLLNNVAVTPIAMLEGACRREIVDNVQELFQSSFGDLGKPSSRPTIGSANGFVYGAIEAYNRHHHLVIRPDDVWITILTQFSLFVNANAELLRRNFVSHDGKKELVVNAVGSRYTVNFAHMAQQMTHLIQENVVDPKLRSWIIPDFTTSTDNDRAVSSMVMMATLKAYFDYRFSLGCGLPAVTLLGEKSDWEKLLNKIEKLPSYGNETTQWYHLLKPVLSHFVAAFDAPDSDANKDFWQKIAHRKSGGSGPSYLSGWITAFTFFSNKGQSLYKRLNGAVIDGVRYHSIDTNDIPAAYAEVNVVLDDNGQTFKSVMVAGMVGFSVADSGVVVGTQHDGKQDTIQAVPGWWMYAEKVASSASSTNVV